MLKKLGNLLTMLVSTVWRHCTTWYIADDLISLSGVPSSPGRPVIELSTNRIQAQADENSVTDEINLAWDVPDDDGGYPITGKSRRLQMECKRMQNHATQDKCVWPILYVWLDRKIWLLGACFCDVPPAVQKKQMAQKLDLGTRISILPSRICTL